MVCAVVQLPNRSTVMRFTSSPSPSVSFDSIIPACAAYAENVDPSAATLSLADKGYAKTISDKRRDDFLKGRACAGLALEQLGYRSYPVPRGNFREPIWPVGICGSITHCDGFCAAIVAHQGELQSIGIDAESTKHPGIDLFGAIATVPEASWMNCAGSDAPWDLILFSVKESIFKAWFPIQRTWLEFKQVCVTFEPSAKTFQAVLSQDAGDGYDPPLISGYFDYDHRHVISLATLRASHRRLSSGANYRWPCSPKENLDRNRKLSDATAISNCIPCQPTAVCLP
jgi:4'-phosphopantetheinyl transferase EntD